MADNSALVQDIAKGTSLKKASIEHDASAPIIEKDVKVQKNSHGELMKEVSQGKNLNHVETVDKSAPVVEKDVHIKENTHKAVFDEIKTKSS